MPSVAERLADGPRVSYPSAMSEPSVISIGNFDGVHRGHQALMGEVSRRAAARGVRSVAVTFEPHPIALLRPDQAPPPLMPVQDRVAALQAAGVDEVELMTPTSELLSLDPAAFVKGMVDWLAPREIVEGPDFHFGKRRAGDVGTLRQLGEVHGFAVGVVEPVRVGLSDLLVAPVSSSVIRWLVGHGRVGDAALCLGRPYTLSGEVVRGEQRGRTIDVPTANLSNQALDERLCPGDGVYAGLAELEDSGEAYPAAISVGIKPTFGESRLTVEGHLLDFDGDLYGRRMRLSFACWLRGQSAYPDKDALVTQLRRDIAAVRRLSERGRLGRLPVAGGPGVVSDNAPRR